MYILLIILVYLVYVWLTDEVSTPKPKNNRVNSRKFTQEDEIILCLERALKKNMNVEIQYAKKMARVLFVQSHRL